MFIIIQRQIHVNTDIELKVKEYEDTPDDDVEYFNTFIIEHEANSNGTFTVSVSPYSTEQDSIMCEVPSKFTVDYEGLKEIYKDPAKFILDYVVKYDERYEVSDDCEEVADGDFMEFDHVDLSRKSTLYELPQGFTVTQFTNKDGKTEDIIVYSNDCKTATDEDIKLLNLALGEGNYRLLPTKLAKAYIKKKERILEKDELEKPSPDKNDRMIRSIKDFLNELKKNPDIEVTEF